MQKKSWRSDAFSARINSNISGGERVMTCWHCNNELEFNAQRDDFLKLYHCSECDKWYEMRKERERVNGAVPVRFVELEDSPVF